MTVVLTCGHIATDEDGEHGLGISIGVKDMDRMGNPCVAYPSVCRKCYEWYKDNKLIVEDKV